MLLTPGPGAPTVHVLRSVLFTVIKARGQTAEEIFLTRALHITVSYALRAVVVPAVSNLCPR